MTTTNVSDDPNVKMPAAVRAAAERSNEIIRQMTAANEQQVTTEGNPELSAQSLAENNEQQVQENNQQDFQKKDAAPEEDSWEHKYKSVHGRYLRSQEQIRELSEQVQNLQSAIASLQAATPSTPMPDFTTERLITEDEERDYGSDFLKVVGKKAREELGPVIKGYESKIAELEDQLRGVRGVVVQDNQAKLMSTLDTRLPTWRDLNTNQEFLNWLLLPDPYSGAIRHDMLKAAYAQGNANRVLAFFNGFLAEEAATSPAGSEPDTGTRVPKVPLSSLAAPGRAKTAAGNNAPAEKPSFTRAEIAAFYSDIAADKYRGRDDQKNKLEAQIFEAQREGRIR